MASLIALPLLLTLLSGVSTAAIDADMQPLLMRLATQGGVASPGDLKVERPPRRVYEIGAVVDAGDRRGPLVLAVTPAGAAARMGLRPGDRLLSVNGRAFAGQREPALVLQQALEQARGDLRLRVVRDQKALSLAGQARAIDLPGYQLVISAADAGCARISTFDVAARSAGLYPAVLIAIDGRTPGPSASETFRVTPGRHVLTVGEKIAPAEFNAPENVQRAHGGRDRYRTLVLDAVAHQTYRLEAKLLRPRRASVASGAYWEPVVSGKTTERCR